MSGGGINFQTPTALYQALAGQGQPGLFGATPFPFLNDKQFGFGANSPYLGALGGIQSLDPGNVWPGVNAKGQENAPNVNPPGSVASNTNELAQSGAGLLSSIPGLQGYAGQALTNAFDPQNALFNKLFQQQQDQSNAENAMAGVATTPYGAALTQQGNQNFDLAWQQQQLQREAQGAGTAGNLLGAAGGVLGNAGQAINVPANLTQQQISDYLNYINSSVNAASAFTSGTNSATNAGANSTNALANAAQANNSGKGGLGSALGGIGSLAGKFASGGKA